MAAKHRQDTSSTTAVGRPRRLSALLLAAALAGAGVLLGVTAPSADAADRTATISLTGVTSNTYPTGGNTVWVQPGSPLTISEAPISVGANQGLLGTVSSIVNGILGAVKVVDLRANVDLSSVGRGSVALGGGGAASVTTPALKKGVYPFAWSFTAITVKTDLLGHQTRGSVNLNGNQLNKLGLKLNAKNQYVGYIVSDTKSPCGGAQCISLQTPTLSVAPSVPVVGQLPTVTVPGQNVNIPVPSVPGVNAPASGLPGVGSGTPSTGASTPAGSRPTTGATGSSSPTNPYGYTAPDCTGPCAVMPRGGGNGGNVGGAYGVTLGDLGQAGTAAGGSGTGGTDAGPDAAAAIAAGGNPLGNGSGQLAVDNAFDGSRSGSTAPALPTTLTIVAVAAFVGASGLWFVRRRAARG